MTTPQLYGYFRSSAAYRVRIALNLKGLSVQHVPVHLLRNGGEQLADGYRARNPQALVPLLVEDDWQLSQSLAILEYLEETHPQPQLLPGDARQRAHIRQLALLVACDVHPLNNLRVLKYLKHALGTDDAAKETWIRHWIDLGFGALEAMLAPGGRDTPRFCVGDTPTLADCCLVPQLFNARRFGIDVDSAYPTLAAIERTCAALPAFADAHPSRQPDAE
jgi:maleylpyruvate isomerase